MNVGEPLEFEHSFSFKNSYLLKESLDLRVVSPLTSSEVLPETSGDNAKSWIKRSYGKEAQTPKEAIRHWFSVHLRFSGGEEILWGEDGVGIVLPASCDDRAKFAEKSRRNRTGVTFLYRKAGNVPVVRWGVVDRVDEAKGTMTLFPGFRPHPKTFLLDEIMGFYPDAAVRSMCWHFRFEPLPRNRVRVSYRADDEFEREKLRIGGEKPGPLSLTPCFSRRVSF